MNRAVIAIVLSLVPLGLPAHGPRAPTPGNLITIWTPEIAAIAVLLLFAMIYARGVRNLWHCAGRTAAISRTNVIQFAAGCFVLALSTVSPLHSIGAALFSAHMVQHELLVTVAAPLLVLGKPVAAFAWAIPVTRRRRVGRMFSSPPVRETWRIARGIPGTTILHAAALWVWHVPALYEWSIHSSAGHALQHATFLASALLFWTATLPRANSPQTASRTDLAAAGALFATVLHTGILGALITLSSRLWYPHYGLTTAPWGLMPMEDQQLAGLIMWIPGSVTYMVVALIRGWHVLTVQTVPVRRSRVA